MRPFKKTRTSDMFQRDGKVGKGTFGEVWKARVIGDETGEICAFKKVLMESEKEGFPVTSLREIKLLKRINHENIVKLREIVVHPQVKEKGRGIYMVFEYVEHDLAGLLKAQMSSFTTPEIMCLSQQLLNGLYYMHSNDMIHRDLKSANILVSAKGVLKIADFGLARAFEPELKHLLTPKVCTLWYRAPELLLGQNDYGPAIDMWAAGCIIAELFNRKPIFMGARPEELEQYRSICKTCGAPTKDSWPGYQGLPCGDFAYPRDLPTRNRMRETLERMTSGRDRAGVREAISLMAKLLLMNPDTRLTADEALDHLFFWSDPRPCKPEEIALPKLNCHELTARPTKQRDSKRREVDHEKNRANKRRRSPRL